MKMQKTLLATLIAAAVMSTNAFAADAVDGGAATADSLNTTTLTATNVGNRAGTTTIEGSSVGINGDTTVTIGGSTVGINGDTTVTGTLDVTDATTTAGLTNTGDVTTDTLTTTANADVGGDLDVVGATTTAGLTNTGDIATGTLQTSGLATLESASITNNADVGGNLAVTGSASINGGGLNASLNNLSGTTAAMGQAYSGSQGANVDANGKITNGAVSQTTSSMTVTNSLGNTHGYMVNETQATMSGGMNSTSMTLNDNGATFSNSATGAPVVVTGVANGTTAYDAVNYSQLSQLQNNNDARFNNINNTLDDYAAGMAGITAMTNIPQVEQGKTFAVGMGMGGYDKQGGIAIGASLRAAPNFVLKASASTGMTQGGNSTTGYGMGGAYSW